MVGYAKNYVLLKLFLEKLKKMNSKNEKWTLDITFFIGTMVVMIALIVGI
jgi:hypothetical protein